MRFRILARYALSRVGLLTPVQRLLWHKRRRFGRLDRVLIEAYFRSTLIRKLHIGCGQHILPGWLNSDYYPRSSSILHLVATCPFPLPPESFDYIFSEHMIEHVPYSAGLFMLRECHRVLKRSAKIRISTPNLKFLVDLYNGTEPVIQKQYVEWQSALWCGWAPGPDKAFIINNFFRAWGHQFIYDERTLAAAMTKAGFIGIVRCPLQESDSEALRNLEHETRLPPGFLRLETMTLEGTKP